MSRSGDGTWTAETKADGDVGLPPPGGSATELQGALDIDLGLSPLANTMPVLRHHLTTAGSGPIDFLMAWVSVPDLAIVPSRQRYTFIRHESENSIIRFSSGTFTEDVAFDAEGLVIHYPSIGKRV